MVTSTIVGTVDVNGVGSVCVGLVSILSRVCRVVEGRGVPVFDMKTINQIRCFLNRK